MREAKVDLWEAEVDLRCVTTNGTIYWSHQEESFVNPMGAGCAWEAQERFPEAPQGLGTDLRLYGPRVTFIGRGTLAFPVKFEVSEKADLRLILRSTFQLLDIVGPAELQVAIPQPGCGHGGLDWESLVKPAIEPYLDDRFLIVDYPQESTFR